MGVIIVRKKRIVANPTIVAGNVGNPSLLRLCPSRHDTTSESKAGRTVQMATEGIN